MTLSITAGLPLFDSTSNSVRRAAEMWAAEYGFQVAWAGTGHLEMRRGTFLRGLFTFRFRCVPCLVTIKWNPGESRFANCTYRAQSPWTPSAGDRRQGNAEFSALIQILSNGPEAGPTPPAARDEGANES